MHKKYKAIIYDWDGCLLRSLPTWVDAHSTLLEKAGIKASVNKIARAIGHKDALEILGHTDVEQASKDFHAYLAKHIGLSELYPDVMKTLNALKAKGINIFIASSSKRELFNVTPVFKNVEKYLEHAIFADDVTDFKPSPEAINIILKKYNIPKEQVLMIGDSDKDILAAHNANIDIFWFAPKENETIHNFKYLNSLNPTKSITSHYDVMEYV